MSFDPFAYRGGVHKVLADFSKAAYTLQSWELQPPNDVSPGSASIMNDIYNNWEHVNVGSGIITYCNINSTSSTPPSPPISGSTFVFSNCTYNGIFTNGNAAGFAARSGDTVVISFRGTNDLSECNTSDPRNMLSADYIDWFDKDGHYAKCIDFVNLVDDYIAKNDIKHVYVTGHSLGGAMARAYMDSHPGDMYRAITFAAPAYTAMDFADQRITRIEADWDVVPDSGVSMGSTLHFDGINWSESDYSELHSMDNYRQIIDGLNIDEYNKLVEIADNGGLEISIGADVLGQITLNETNVNGGVFNGKYTQFYSITKDDFINDSDRVIFGGPGDDIITGMVSFSSPEFYFGGIGNDVIKGVVSDHDEYLDGGSGEDTLEGGPGDDVYIVDNVKDLVIEGFDFGIDTVKSYVTWSIGSVNLENLTLLGGDAINATGNSSSNTLEGNSAANILNGGSGIDNMIGREGGDTYYVDNASDITTETSSLATEIDTVISSVTRSLGANFEKLILTGTAAINGTGNGLANTLIGNGAANILNGGTGVDTMIGGIGNDTYYVDNASDITFETSSLATEIDTVISSVTRSLGTNFEKLILTGTAAINGTGNSLANTLLGNSAANILNGGTGVDTMIGGIGNDTYYVDNASDITFETSSLATEIDTVISSVTRSLGTNFEKLILTGTAAINGTGNSLANTLLGNSAANVLVGGTGNDNVNGGVGNDVLYGGFGIDTLTGGTGTDLFVYNSGLNAATNRDIITDFITVDDTIMLDQTIFTKLTTRGTLSSIFFRSSNTGTALDNNDYLLYNMTTGSLLYDFDGNGAGLAVQFANISNKPALTPADFIVIA